MKKTVKHVNLTINFTGPFGGHLAPVTGAKVVTLADDDGVEIAGAQTHVVEPLVDADFDDALLAQIDARLAEVGLRIARRG